MNDAQIRQALISAYPGPKWASKVKKMTEAQAFATYMRLKGAGKLK